MRSILLKSFCVLIYIVYAYIFGWQIYFYNQQSFLESAMSTLAVLSLYMPAVILLLYVVLLYINIALKQKRMLAVNSFIAAAVIGLYNTTQALVITAALVVFGLVMAALEIRDGQR